MGSRPFRPSETCESESAEVVPEADGDLEIGVLGGEVLGENSLRL